MSDDELLLRVAALKVISDFAKEQYDLARAEAAEVMNDGDKRVVRSPVDGAKIGPVSKSDPPVCSVLTDEAALAEWMEAFGYGDLVETGYKVIASEAELVSVLIVYAPNLLKRIKKVKRAVVAQIHADTLAAGQPVGPGGEADLPGISLQRNPPVVSCRPDPDSALLAVMELVHNHQMMLDGTIVKELQP